MEFDLAAHWPFSDTALTQLVNDIDNQYGYCDELGLFVTDGVSSTTVEVAIHGDTITVLAETARGGAPEPRATPSDRSEFIRIPVFKEQNTIQPATVQDWVSKANRQYQPKTLEESVAEWLAGHRYDHDLTREWIRIGALKGKITDGQGTELLDIYSAFGVVQPTLDLELDVAGTNVTAKISALRQQIRRNLRGEIMTGVGALCSTGFFDALVEHPLVKDKYLNYAEAQALRRGDDTDYGRVFPHQGVTFLEYDGVVTLAKDRASATTTDLIEDGKAHAFPLGTRDALRTHDGPIDHVGFVNQAGVPIVITQEMRPHGAGIEVQSQSATLSYCTKPACLVELTAS